MLVRPVVCQALLSDWWKRNRNEESSSISKAPILSTHREETNGMGRLSTTTENMKGKGKRKRSEPT